MNNAYHGKYPKAAKKFAEDIRPLTTLVISESATSSSASSPIVLVTYPTPLDVCKAKFPGHYRMHQKTMKYVRGRHPTLDMPGGAFSAVAVNSGDKVATRRHTDPKNNGPSFCCITAYGDLTSRLRLSSSLNSMKSYIRLNFLPEFLLSSPPPSSPIGIVGS